ncbi:hypothetical protein G3N95_37560 [Paraburkholderia sp. Tr-20389]|uniref:hypothetical protein n=1 Tax=Paraburkholderia sp. Tr-20389 TaxID=2703903 RepID=UPI00197D21A0|nr:hypothetical protein [Paraburkholderia sp. Tr-20389]MBN3758668.1 hypothetical protein [Paraburkholderia sp. Tr-20389]
MRDTPVIERKPRSNSVINSSSSILASTTRRADRFSQTLIQQRFAGDDRKNSEAFPMADFGF